MIISPYLLSEPRMYDYFRKNLTNIFINSTRIDEFNEGIKQIVYEKWHSKFYYLSDHIFNSYWNDLYSEESLKAHNYSFVKIILKQISDYYFNDDSRYISIKLDKFAEWQDLISFQSSLPILAFNIYIRKWNDNINELGKITSSCLLYPYNRHIEDYIDQSGLYDTHIHLNGTTQFETVWQYSLLSPDKIREDLQKEKENNKSLRFLYSNPIFDDVDCYYDLLLISRMLRLFILNKIHNKKVNKSNEIKILYVLFDLLCNKKLTHSNLKKIQFYSLEKLYLYNEDDITYSTEIHFHLDVLKYLSVQKDNIIDYCYLFYLVCMNCYQRILVQRDDEYGFEQFQKFADSGARESVEKEYKLRFEQLNGKKKNLANLNILEGRFSPKSELKKNEYILNSILNGFYSYKEQKRNSPRLSLRELISHTLNYNRPTLKLVSHFIKKPWNEKGFYFQDLREDLRCKRKTLFETFNKYPDLRKIITGIDAASNEMDTPPEIFAETYNDCRKQGIKHFTYHVGEDFKHLLSGIRFIYDAITFLDLKNGDRIGHGTSIGILPEVWIKTMPKNIFISKGEWLENLLFLHHFLSSQESDTLKNKLRDIELKIEELFVDIFSPSEYISINVMKNFFENRHLVPEIVAMVEQEKLPINFNMSEITQVYNLQKKDKNALKLLKARWYDKNVLKKYAEEIIISIDYINETLFLKLQQYVQSIIVKKKIIVESLPTSNVRISLYKSIYEHHIFRWLHLPERKVEGDSKMLITLGSDDPGIFSVDLKSEIYHIFAVLVCQFNYSDQEALDKIKELNENGRLYSFIE